MDIQIKDFKLKLQELRALQGHSYQSLIQYFKRRKVHGANEPVCHQPHTSWHTFQTKESYIGSMASYNTTQQSTVKPIYNGHLWEMARWPLYTGWLLYTAGFPGSQWIVFLCANNHSIYVLLTITTTRNATNMIKNQQTSQHVRNVGKWS